MAFLLGGAALAQDPRGDAAALSRKGKEAYAAKDFSRAAEAFEASYEVVPRASAIYNAALAWVLAGEKVRAANAFRIALDKTDLHGEEATNARSELDKLEPGLGWLEVSAPPGSFVTVKPLARVPGPASTYVPPGEHMVQVALATGKIIVKTVAVSQGKSVRVAMGFEALEGAPSTSAEVRAPARVEGAAENGPARPLRTLGWVLVGVSGVSLASGTYFGVRTLSARDEFVASGETSQLLHDDAVRFRTMSNVALIGGGVVGLVGLGLILFSK